MMMRDHERIEELLSVQVLAELDASERRELAEARAEHEPDCVECARLERELSEVAGLLPFALDPVPVDPSIADRVLAAGAVAARDPAPRGLGERRTERDRRGVRTWAAGAAVAAVLVATLVVVGTADPSRVEVTRAHAANRIVSFEPAGVVGTLTVAYTPDERGAVLWGHVPDPGEGNTYEVWMIDGDTPVSGGCASPVDGRLALAIDADVGTTEMMAVTVEPTSCPARPTSDPVFVAPLTA